MNAEFEKYWKSSRASDRPFAETNAQILDKMIAKTHFLAGAAAMREKCVEVANSMAIDCPSEKCPEYPGIDDCMYKETGFCIAATIRKIEVE